MTLDRTAIALAADKAEAAIDLIHDDITASAAPALPNLGTLAGAVDRLAGIFDIDGDDAISDGVLRAIDTLSVIANYIAVLARQAPATGHTEITDPVRENLRLLQAAEAMKDPARARLLVDIADRYLSDALRTAYRRSKQEPTAETGTSDHNPTLGHPAPGMADLRLPYSLANAILDLRSVVINRRTTWDEDDVTTDINTRIIQASLLHGAGVTPDALAAFLKIAAAGRVRATDVEALNRALGFLPKPPTTLAGPVKGRPDLDDSEDIDAPDLAPTTDKD